MTEPARFAQIAVLAHLGRAGGLFTYNIPEGLAALISQGSLVRVPFASRQVQGIVYSLENTCDLPRVRDVAELLDPVPVVTPLQLHLAEWMARYYRAPISDVMGALVPSGLGRKTIYLVELGAEPTSARFTPEQQQVMDEVKREGRMSVEALQTRLPDVDVQRAVTSLVRRRALLRLSELAPPRVQAALVRIVSVTSAGHEALRGDLLHRAVKREAVLSWIAAHEPVTTPEVSRAIPGASGAIKALAGANLVHVVEQIQSRSRLQMLTQKRSVPLHLSGAQRQAFDDIVHSLDRPGSDIFLLHGVTGSGKTEVYLQSIAETLRRGRQAIVMVPEISLTPQAVERVSGRFPGRVAVLHSRLSPGERLDEWQRIRHGEVDVVVGPRSALFAPLPRPGLIVVDEEHDPSYKQDSSPRYHARDTAAVLGRLSGATVVFGSATPDVSTYFAAQSGRIHLLELPDRPVWGDSGAARPMPAVEVVDMRHELKTGNRSIFSTPLLREMDETLRSGHQALLFLNRRGSATVVLCRDCGYVARCPNCDIPFTYHSAVSRLICHRCDKRAPSPRACPACGGPRIRYLGIGTQKVEEETARLFPRARVLRWDRDVTGGKDAHAQILRRFADHEADILVGTQMIAKGLDFPLVTLVGVISADANLHMPDFRAPERSFQLLTQVAGRAGRASLSSKVVVQTYTPEHYAIQAAREHDYHRFYADEMSFRRTAGYPPFARMARFVYSSEDADGCRRAAADLLSILERGIIAEGLEGIEIIGPAPCFVSKVKNRYYWQVIARADGRAREGLHPLLDYVPPGWSIDVDPVDLL